MARDRQRAKQRRARREKAGRPPQGDGLSQPIREDLPGQLEHASGEVDEFDAKLVAEAGGEPAPEGTVGDGPGVAHPEALSDEEFAELEDRIDEVEDLMETGDREAVAEAREELEEDITERRRTRVAAPAPAGAPTARGPGRFIAFLRASWAELQRVQWPDRRQVGQATAVVLGFVVVAGLYLGLADFVSQEIVDLII